jgi:hypothetical protein
VSFAKPHGASARSPETFLKPMTRPEHLLILPASLALAACGTTAPIVDRLHPASADAAESAERPLPRLLGADEHTRRTHELLAQREAQARAAENEAPGNEANIAPPKIPKPTSHEHHQ